MYIETYSEVYTNRSKIADYVLTQSILTLIHRTVNTNILNSNIISSTSIRITLNCTDTCFSNPNTIIQFNLNSRQHMFMFSVFVTLSSIEEVSYYKYYLTAS